MTARQWMMTLAIGVGFLLVVAWSHERDKDARLDFLRQQFRLPDGVAFSDYRNISKSSVALPRVQAIVRFSPEQFQAYVSGLDDPRVWRPGHLSPGGGTEIPVSSEALRWSDMQGSNVANDLTGGWGDLSREQVSQIRNGRVLCFALTMTRPDSGAGSASRYGTKACSDIAPTDVLGVYVLGALDLDTRALHMIAN